MPKNGFVSITVDEDFYLKIQNEYNRNKVILKRIGMRSMTGFYISMIETLMTDDKLYNLILKKLSKDVTNSLNDMRKTK